MRWISKKRNTLFRCLNRSDSEFPGNFKNSRLVNPVRLSRKVKSEIKSFGGGGENWEAQPNGEKEVSKKNVE